MRFTLRTAAPVAKNLGVKKPSNSTWSKKEVIWNENALFYKLFCTKKGFVIRIHKLIPKLAVTVQGCNLRELFLLCAVVHSNLHYDVW